MSLARNPIAEFGVSETPGLLSVHLALVSVVYGNANKRAAQQHKR